MPNFAPDASLRSGRKEGRTNESRGRTREGGGEGMEGALLRFNFASHSGICEQYLSAHKRDRDGRERQRARAGGRWRERRRCRCRSGDAEVRWDRWRRGVSRGSGVIRFATFFGDPRTGGRDGGRTARGGGGDHLASRRAVIWRWAANGVETKCRDVILDHRSRSRSLHRSVSEDTDKTEASSLLNAISILYPHSLHLSIQ